MRFSRLVAMCVLLTVAGMAMGAGSAPENPFALPGNWYRANFHAHSTVSDGDVPLAERAGQYREEGYDILAITDHEKTNDVAEFCTDEFLLISGMETHPVSPNPGMKYHLVCLNIPRSLTFDKGTPVEARMKALKEAGVYVIAAHPNWCGFTLDELWPLRDLGVDAVEVFNTTCGGCGRSNSAAHWDMMLYKGWNLPAVAVDDVHDPGSLFKGWTMVKAEELTVDAVMDAMRRGAYYASTGPEIKDVRVEDGVVKVECSPAAEVRFMCNAPNGRVICARNGKPLTGAQYKPDPKRVRYLRIEVVGMDGKTAWTNAIAF